MSGRLKRFVCGTLRVRVQGDSVARFMSLCSRHGIVFWEVCAQEGAGVSFWMYLSDVKALPVYLRKTKTRFRILQRRGACFLWKRYRTHAAYPAAALASVGLVLFLLTRVWRIEIAGNSALGTDTLLSYLDAQGISCGMAKTAVDNEALELSLRQDFEQVIWASVYEEGTKLVVQIQEKLAVQETDESDVCTDLVAAKDAVVASIITRSGDAMVKAGDTVQAGDLLVCGRQEIYDDNGELLEYYYKSADADIYGYTSYEYTEELPLQTTTQEPTGESHVRFFLQLGNLRFVTPTLFAEYAYSRTTEETAQFSVGESFYLPVCYGSICTEELCEVTTELDEEAAYALAEEHFLQFLSDLEENGVRITDKNVMMEQTGESYRVYGRAEACESITETAPTEIKQKEESADEPE